MLGSGGFASLTSGLSHPLSMYEVIQLLTSRALVMSALA
jgi:hypothetical protein